MDLPKVYVTGACVYAKAIKQSCGFIREVKEMQMPCIADFFGLQLIALAVLYVWYMLSAR